MCGIKSKFSTGFILVIFLQIMTFFTSCKSDIKIVVQKDSILIKYDTKLGKALFETVYAFAGEDEEGKIFDTEQFKTVFTESGLDKVVVESKELDQISIQVATSDSKKNFISESSILKSSNNGKNVEVVFSKARLLDMYDKMPVMMRSYIDLFMAPAFTDEEMTDTEYIELIASVYGQVLADEIAGSVINFEIETSDGKNTKTSLRLLDLININEELTLKI